MTHQPPRLHLIATLIIGLLFVESSSAFSRNDTVTPDMQVIEPGSFEMGAASSDPASSPDELPRHSVTITQSYLVARHQVTRGEFATFIDATDHQIDTGCWSLTREGWIEDPAGSWQAPGYDQTDAHPAVCISRLDALAYIEWLSNTTDRTYRLPSEAEWELAARGTGAQPFWGIPENICTFGNVNDITSKNKVAKVGENCRDNALYTAPVGSYEANPNGLFDMIGNAWEWTADCASADYQHTPTDGSAWTTANCATYSLRGHSWTDAPGPVRIETRYALPPGARQSIVGFRVVAD